MPSFFLYLLILIPAFAFASPAEEPEEASVPILDSFQQLLGGNINFVANRLDSFFATDRADDEFGRSRIRIRSIFLLRERAISDLNTQYRLNLKLPNLENKFKYEFFKGKKAKDKEKNLKSKDASPKKPDNEGWIFNADMGISVAVPPKLVTRARVRRNFITGPFTHRFVEQLTYITDESGLREETSLNSDHAYSEKFLFRFVNEKRWQIIRKEFNTNHGPTWLHSVSDNDAFVYSATMQTIIENGVWHTTNYQLAINYRRNLYKQWFYLDIIPGIDFPKFWSFRRTPFITFQLELLFGR